MRWNCCSSFSLCCLAAAHEVRLRTCCRCWRLAAWHCSSVAYFSTWRYLYIIWMCKCVNVYVCISYYFDMFKVLRLNASSTLKRHLQLAYSKTSCSYAKKHTTLLFKLYLHFLCNRSSYSVFSFNNSKCISPSSFHSRYPCYFFSCIYVCFNINISMCVCFSHQMWMWVFIFYASAALVIESSVSLSLIRISWNPWSSFTFDKISRA